MKTGGLSVPLQGKIAPVQRGRVSYPVTSCGSRSGRGLALLRDVARKQNRGGQREGGLERLVLAGNGTIVPSWGSLNTETTRSKKLAEC